MANIDNESFNKKLYDLLKVRGYKPAPLNAQNQRVQASQDADVIEFTFIKDGKEYGKAWVSIDDAQNLIVYYDSEQENSPDNETPGLDYDDTWVGFLKLLKQWAQRRQMNFELSNKDRLGDDMRQREHYKMKKQLGEGYHPMGKKASYNEAVPNVKIVLQHNRALEEGEQRYRNVAKIYLENAEGERFLAPTTRPGLARVYARHIAEGGVPNDDRWNHIKGLCEEYNKMAGFVRATKNKQFNESVQSLVNEGVNHYNNLRENLNKLTGHRGYNMYFESWTPTLMEDEGSDDISEMFMSSSLDPRIESVMPILSRLHKNVSEAKEVNELSNWVDDLISETMAVAEAPGAMTLKHNQSTEEKNLKAFGLAEDEDEMDITWKGSKPWKKLKKDKVEEDESLKSNNPVGIPESIPQPYKKDEMQDYKEQEKSSLRSSDPDLKDIEHGNELEEDLGPEQKKAGQLGPTEKVKNNNIGKLVGGCMESTENDELNRILDIARFSR